MIDKNIMLTKSAYISKKYLKLVLADVSRQDLTKRIERSE